MNAYGIGICIRGRNRRLLPIERAANRSAMTQPGHLPKRQTPMPLNEDPRVRNTNQTATTKPHSTIAPPRIQRKKRCSAEPCAAAGIDNEMSLETIQIAAGIPRPKIKDSNQHPSRPDEALAIGTPDRCVAIVTDPRRRRIVTKRIQPEAQYEVSREKVPPLSDLFSGLLAARS